MQNVLNMKENKVANHSNTQSMIVNKQDGKPV